MRYDTWCPEYVFQKNYKNVLACYAGVNTSSADGKITSSMSSGNFEYKWNNAHNMSVAGFCMNTSACDLHDVKIGDKLTFTAKNYLHMFVIIAY